MEKSKNNDNMKHKLCFVICPFGPPDSDQRKRSDMLLEYVIVPALSEFGHTIIRADLSAEPGVVTTHIIQHLIEDDLLVADITDNNPNVFYELGIRHSIRKPFIQIIREGDKIPFNIQGIQTITYDLQDVAKIKDAIGKIKKQILYYEKTGKVTSPVSVALDSLAETSSVDQFREIMNKLEELDKSVGDAEEFRKKIVDDVKKMVSEIRDYMNIEIIHWKELINKKLSMRNNSIDDNFYSSYESRAKNYYKAISTRPRNYYQSYNYAKDDLYSSEKEKKERRGKGEFTIGEWLDIEERKRKEQQK